MNRKRKSEVHVVFGLRRFDGALDFVFHSAEQQFAVKAKAASKRRSPKHGDAALEFFFLAEQQLDFRTKAA